jgi:hypothetical protein
MVTRFIRWVSKNENNICLVIIAITAIYYTGLVIAAKVTGAL